MGSRVCVGQNIALVEAHKFIVKFVCKFNFKLADPEKLWTTRTQWFSMQYDFNVKLEARLTWICMAVLSGGIRV